MNTPRLNGVTGGAWKLQDMPLDLDNGCININALSTNWPLKQDYDMLYDSRGYNMLQRPFWFKSL